MPVEVISLLSSPIAAPDAAAPRQLKVSSPAARSSPRIKSRHVGSAKTNTTLPEGATARGSSNSTAPKSDDFLFLSDDFDDTNLTSVNSWSTRRQRRTPQRHQDNLVLLSSPPRPGTSNSLASDPFASSPAAPKSPAPIISSKPAKCKDETRLKLQAPAQVQIRTIDLSSDPFGSTPHRDPPKSKGVSQAAAWDPILSSAPEHRDDEHDDSDGSLLGRAFKRSRSNTNGLFDDSSDDEFPDLAKLNASTKAEVTGTTRSRLAASKKVKHSPANLESNLVATTQQNKLGMTALEREAEKERKRQEKEATKFQKARDKENAAALAEVNKLRTDKKVSTPEMIVDLSSSVSESRRLAIEEFLGDLSVQCQTWESIVPNVIRWRRKVKAVFNKDLDQWQPVPMRINEEKHVMVIFTAAEFASLAQGEVGEDLASHVDKLREAHPNCNLIYLIEGLTFWMRKNRIIRNRQYTAEIRSAAAAAECSQASEAAITTAQDAEAQTARTKKRKARAPAPAPVFVDEEIIEDALLQLQVMHGSNSPILIHHTNAPAETAQWIAIFTQHISTIPYRQQRERSNAAAAFCMETGQVRTGENAKDTYIRMLQEIARVTAPVAYGIVSEYETIGELVRGLEKGGPLTLEGIRKSANKDGAFSDRTIGQAMSRRLYKVFMGQDPTSTDI